MNEELGMLELVPCDIMENINSKQEDSSMEVRAASPTSNEDPKEEENEEKMEVGEEGEAIGQEAEEGKPKEDKKEKADASGDIRNSKYFVLGMQVKRETLIFVIISCFVSV